MKQPVNLSTALERTRQKTEYLRSLGVKTPQRQPRVKPRTASETFALCRAVWSTVETARRSGRLTKLAPVGYRLRWEEEGRDE
jgi:hypothetical protein